MIDNRPTASWSRALRGNVRDTLDFMESRYGDLKGYYREYFCHCISILLFSFAPFSERKLILQRFLSNFDFPLNFLPHRAGDESADSRRRRADLSPLWLIDSRRYDFRVLVICPPSFPRETPFLSKAHLEQIGGETSRRFNEPII